VVFEVKEDLNNEVSWNRLPITACRGVWCIACLKTQNASQLGFDFQRLKIGSSSQLIGLTLPDGLPF
jgi:hypothetical protein